MYYIYFKIKKLFNDNLYSLLLHISILSFLKL